MQDYARVEYLNCIFAFLIEQTIRNKTTEDTEDTEPASDLLSVSSVLSVVY